MNRSFLSLICCTLALVLTTPVSAEDAKPQPTPAEKAAKAAKADRGEQMRKAIISKVDTDKDGMISAQENLAAASGRFDTMDTNKDGFMTADEVQKATKEFSGQEIKNPKIAENRAKSLQAQVTAMDVNKDSKVSRDEYTGRMANLFMEQDLNKDGKVTSAEMKEHAAKRFAEMRAKIEERRKKIEAAKAAKEGAETTVPKAQ